VCSLSFLHSFFTYLCLVSYFFLVLQHLVLVSSSTSITKSTKFLLRLQYFFIFFIVVLILVLAHRYTLYILYSSSIIIYLLSGSIRCVRITSWSHTKNFCNYDFSLRSYCFFIFFIVIPDNSYRFDHSIIYTSSTTI